MLFIFAFERVAVASYAASHFGLSHPNIDCIIYFSLVDNCGYATFSRYGASEILYLGDRKAA